MSSKVDVLNFATGGILREEDAGGTGGGGGGGSFSEITGLPSENAALSTALGLKADNTTYALAKFIMAGSVINIPAQYANLTLAVAYLSDKWSNGTVTIQYADGTYTEAGVAISTSGIPNLLIKGNSSNRNAVTINYSSPTLYTILLDVDSCTVSLYYLNINQNSANTKYGNAISTNKAKIIMLSCTINNFRVGTFSNNNGYIYSYLPITTNCTYAFWSTFGATLLTNGACTITNCTYGLFADYMGRMSSAPAPTFSGVTTQYSPAINTLGNQGALIGM